MFTVRALFTLLLGLTLATSLVKGQAAYERYADIAGKKDKALLHEARQLVNLQNYGPAITILDKLIERNPINIDLYYMRGALQKELRRYPGAISDFLRGIGLSEDYKKGIYLDLGETHLLNKDATAAKKSFQRFLNIVGPNDPAYAKASELLKHAEVVESLMANPVPFAPEPLAGAINTREHMEYFPSLSVDGTRMIFVRRLNQVEEDFFESIRLEDGSWGPPQPLEYVNSPYNEGAQTVSADGSLIVYTICHKPGTRGGCDLYFTERTEKGWTRVANMGSNINTRWDESQPTLSADGNLLFFSSTRGGGQGAADIWGSARNERGDWSPPINLGPTINTKGDDRYPFFHPDGKSLYFTSDGHPGMGGQDLFVSTLGADNRWGKPRNLGYPINTEEEETNIFIDLAGRRAYFAKQARGDAKNNDIDIYTFELPEEVRPTPVTYVRATVVDAESKKELEAEVLLRSMDEAVAPKKYKTTENGTFLIVLPAGKNYALTVEQDGYFPYSKQFSLDEGYAPENPYEVRIELRPAVADNLPRDEAIVLRNVLFNTGSAELLPVSYPELDRLYELLTDLPDIKIEIGGHTDNVGSEAANLQLSEDRAKAVRQYLMERGIPAERLEYRGYGESDPTADNDTSAGRAENRRTEFRVQ